MKWKFFFSLGVAVAPLASMAQNFALSPYLNGTTSVKDGVIEVGPEFKRSPDAFSFVRLYARLPLSNKDQSIATVDRSLNSWRGIASIGFETDQTSESGPVSWFGFSLQAEYGRNRFTYYPTGVKSNEARSSKTSVAGEVKLYSFYSEGKSGARQSSPQLRVRYGREYKAADEVGVVGAPNSIGITSVTNLRIDGPSLRPVFSPAFAYQFYPGKNNFSFTPAVYFDRIGGEGEKSPFKNGSGRFRLEFWTFYYPLADVANLKIGLSPYVTMRTFGTDNLNKVEFGGQISLRTGVTFMDFF